MKNRNGVVLIIVLWLLIIVAALSFSLASTVQSLQVDTSLAIKEAALEAAIESQVDNVTTLLAADNNEYDHLSEPHYQRSSPRWRRQFDSARAMVITLRPEDNAAPHASVRLILGISDLASRINLRTTSADIIAQLPGMDPAIASEMVRLRSRLQGQSHPWQFIYDWYQAWRQWGGDSADRPPENEVLACVTLLSAGPEMDSKGLPRVNINRASLQRLHERLGSTLSGEQITALYQSRTREPFSSIADPLIRPLTLVDDQGSRIVYIEPATYRRIVDRISVTDKSVVAGRINVNTAPGAILSLLDGIEPATLARIISRRVGIGSGARDIGWLLDDLRPDEFAKLADQVTTRSYQFTADVIASTNDGAICRATRCVWQRKDGNVSLLRYQPLSGVQWPRQLWDAGG